MKTLTLSICLKVFLPIGLFLSLLSFFFYIFQFASEIHLFLFLILTSRSQRDLWYNQKYFLRQRLTFAKIFPPFFLILFLWLNKLVPPAKNNQLTELSL